jgi:VWFA-related protein
VRARLICLLAACLALAEPNLVQQTTPAAPASTPGKEDANRNATLSFLAVDHDGHPVAHLQAAELSLRIDNEPGKILSLTPTNDGPRTIGIFFDVSGSRRFDEVIVKEVQATAKFLQSIWHAGDMGFVVVFDDSPYALAKPTLDLQQIQAALQTVPMEVSRGATALYDALCSIRFGPQTRDGERVFVVVSDFEDNSSHISKGKTIQTMQEEGVRIVVLLRALGGRPRPETALRDKASAKELAEKTGGDVFVVTNQMELDAAFHRLAGELQGSYRLTYEPLSSGGKPKKLELITTRRDADLFYTKN